MSESKPESVERLLQALADVPAHVAVLRGPEHVYEFVNDRYADSIDLEVPIGKPFGSTGHRVGVEMVALLDGVYRTGVAWVGREVEVKTRDGNTAFFNVTFHPLRDGEGKVDGVLIHSFDVTELVRARQIVAEKEARLRRIVDANMIGVAFWGEPGGTFLDVNEELARILSRTREELLDGSVDWRTITPEEHRRHDQRIARELRAEGVCKPFEIEYLRPDGSRVQVLIAIVAFDSDARSGATLVVDLTERVRAEREHAALQNKLLQVQKLESLGVLAGGIAHDFNNLLTAVLGSVSAAALMLPSESPAQSVLADGLAGVRRATDLTRQLLAYSGKGHFQVRAVDLSTQVRELGHLLETTLPKKVHLRLELGVGLPPVQADVAQMQQVIMNLVINAAEAIGDERGTVLVTTGVQSIDADYAEGLFSPTKIESGRYVFLEVHDTGCGMDAETKAKIFDPFFTTKFTGRGLGLAAVIGIVRGHQGALKVYSTPGKGTTFKVLFPAASGDVALVTKRDPFTDYRGSGLVLIVDDDRGVRRAAGLLLKLFGFDVLEAEDGRKGVEVFAAHANDIVAVLLDMTMPELSGEETFRELRKLRADVPVILSSGYNEVEATRRFTAKGLAGFLPKPFSPEDLARCLEAALAKRSDV